MNGEIKGRIASFGLSIVILIVFVYFTKEKIIEFVDIDYWVIFFFIFILLSTVVYAVIHEFGHVLFGWATGYKLDAFAVFGYTFINIDNRYVLKRAYVPGTAGANMMHYAKSKTDSRYGLYILGGIIVTVVVTIVSALSMLHIDNAFVGLFLYTMVLIGVFLTIYNTVPLKIKGVYNDGMVLKLFRKDERSQEVFNKSQSVTLLSLKGVSIKDFPEELFELSESYASVPFANELRVNKSEYLIHNERYAEAESELEAVVHNLDESDKTLRDIVNCFTLLEYLISDANREKVDNIYQNNKKNIDILARYNLTAKYIQIAYKIKFEDYWNIDKEVREFYKLAKKQDLSSNLESDLMKKLLNENSMSCLIQSN